MNVKIKPQVLKAIKDRDDLAEFVNSVLLTYADGGFIRKSEVAAVFTLNRVLRRNIDIASQEYDVISGVFKGVTVEGTNPSDSLFIPNPRLHDLLEENQMILVMKTPRKKKIPSEDSEKMLVKIAKKDMS